MVVYLLRSVQCHAISCKYQFDIVNTASCHLVIFSCCQFVNLTYVDICLWIKCHLMKALDKLNNIFLRSLNFFIKKSYLVVKSITEHFTISPFWRERELSIQSEVGGGEANRRRGDKHQKLDANSGDRILITIKFSTARRIGQVWI